MTQEERVQKARVIMETRIMSEEDFKRVGQAQEEKGRKYAGKRGRSKQETDDIDRFLGDSNYRCVVSSPLQLHWALECCFSFGKVF